MKISQATKRLYIIGIGPGHKDYILPQAKITIKKMDVIIAGKRHLDSFNLSEKEIYTIKGSLSHLKTYISELPENKKIGMIVSGDPSFYSILEWTKRNFVDYKIETISGISSLQYFFNRLNKSYHKSYWVSLHGRDNDFISKINEHRYVALLTDQMHSPHWIAKKMIQQSKKNKMYVGENLSYDNEIITSGLPEEILKKDNSKLSVVIIENENYKG